MTFDEAVALIRLMGWHVEDRAVHQDRESDFYVDVWTGNPHSEATDAEELEHIFDCRVYPTKEQAKAKLVSWVTEANMRPAYDSRDEGFVFLDELR